jgi:Zn-dependent alcohol dehydrogenase
VAPALAFSYPGNELQMAVIATALVVYEKGGPFTETTVQLSPLRTDEVLVDLRATSICHTDLAVQHGKIPMPFPAVLGHEGTPASGFAPATG